MAMLLATYFFLEGTIIAINQPKKPTQCSDSTIDLHFFAESAADGSISLCPIGGSILLGGYIMLYPSMNTIKISNNKLLGCLIGRIVLGNAGKDQPEFSKIRLWHYIWRNWIYLLDIFIGYIWMF